MRWWHHLIHSTRRITVTPPALDDTREERLIWLCSCGRSWDGRVKR